MGTGWSIFLIALGIIMFIGIVRIILKPSESIGEFITDLFLIDLLGDLIELIFESIDFD